MSLLFPKIEFCRWDYLAILICSVPAFYLLGTPAIYIWDEAVYVNASFDMANGASWLLPVDKEYNTKPPLVLWLQAISLSIFPWPEWAVRLPSALSVTGILILLTMALRRWGFQQWSRILVLVAFVGHEGFIRHHISRTGDLDAVMTFFVVGYTLIVLDAIHFKRWTSKHLIFFFVMIAAAFYSKSIAGWMMLGPLEILVLLSPIRKVFFKWKFWLGAILTLLVCFAYYLFRESLEPGYLALTWYSEYMRMFDNVMPWHEQPFNFYFKNFVVLKIYTPWVFFLMAAILYSVFLLKEKLIRDHLLRWIILGLGYMMLISIPAVKLEWYDAPAYPFFSLILGVVAAHLTGNLLGKWKLIWLIPIAFILWRKLNFIQKDIQPRHAFEFEGAMLRQANVHPNTKVFMPVQTPEHRLQLDFYRKLKKKESGHEIQVVESGDQVAVNDQIIISRQNLKIFENQFEVDTITKYKDLGYLIKVLAKKI